jgi:hypothetical protein
MRAWVVVAAVVLLAACTEDAPVNPGGQSPSPTAAVGVTSEAATSPDAESPEEFALDHTWTKAGMTLSLDSLHMGDVDQVCAPHAGGADGPRELCGQTDGGESTIAWLDIAVANDTGNSFEFGPDRGALVIGSRRVEAEMFAGSTAPSEVDDGATVESQMLWLLPMPLDDVLAAGELQVTVKGPGEGKQDGVTGESQTTVRW